MVNQSKIDQKRSWDIWRKSGAIGNIHGRAVGEAYAFFDCNAAPEQIPEELAGILDVVNTPRRLKIFLAKKGLLPVVSRNSLDTELLEIANDARNAGLKYVISARSTPDMSNRETSDELAALLNQAYLSPLYEQGEEFRGGIFYKDERSDRYVSRT